MSGPLSARHRLLCARAAGAHGRRVWRPDRHRHRHAGTHAAAAGGATLLYEVPVDASTLAQRQALSAALALSNRTGRALSLPRLGYVATSRRPLPFCDLFDASTAEALHHKRRGAMVATSVSAGEAQRLCSGASALLPPEALRSNATLVCVRFQALAAMAERERLPLPYACSATGGAAASADEPLAWASTADTACVRERDRRERKQQERRRSGIEGKPPRSDRSVTSQLYPTTLLPSSVHALVNRFSSMAPQGAKRRAGGGSRGQLQRASQRQPLRKKSKPKKNQGGATKRRAPP